MALNGILLYSEVSGFRAIAIPPAFFIAKIPSVPSDPKPDSITPIALLPKSLANELKNVFTVK